MARAATDVLTGEVRRVAITGVGAVTPLGVGSDVLFRRWMRGESAIAEGRAWCRDFDPASFLTRRELRNTDRFAQLAAAACDEAVRQAGWDEPPCPADRVACIVGTALGGMHAVEGEHAAFLSGGAERVSPLGVTRFMPNAPAAILAMRNGWTGESFGLSAACAAGTQAIGMGLLLIRAGIADAAVVGGAEARFTPLLEALFRTMRGTSPTGDARPFDRRRNGFVAGEGAGILVLEDGDCAATRGASVLGWLLGFGSSTDAHHLAIPRPDAQGAGAAMKSALGDAGVRPGQVAYINAHGTSTRLNDELESRAIREVLGVEERARVRISSLKSAAGHLQGAAGAVEAVATLAALRAGVAPPTVGLEEPDEGCGASYVRCRPAPLDRSCGLPFVGFSNSFGLGGHNATIVLQAA